MMEGWEAGYGSKGALMIDHTCRESGIKLVSIDRPGCGFTPSVDIEERLDISSSTPYHSEISLAKGQNIYCR